MEAVVVGGLINRTDLCVDISLANVTTLVTSIDEVEDLSTALIIKTIHRSVVDTVAVVIIISLITGQVGMTTSTTIAHLPILQAGLVVDQVSAKRTGGL